MRRLNICREVNASGECRGKSLHVGENLFMLTERQMDSTSHLAMTFGNSRFVKTKRVNRCERVVMSHVDIYRHGVAMEALKIRRVDLVTCGAAKNEL